MVGAVVTGSHSFRGVDWTAIAGLIAGLSALGILGFLSSFSGPIETAFMARLPCPDSFTTNDCFASHPESYRYVPAEIRGKPGRYIPINNPGDLFGLLFVGSIITGLAAVLLGALALTLKSRLRWVAWSGVVAGGLVLVAWVPAISRAGD